MEVRWLEKVSSKYKDCVLPDANVRVVEIDSRGSGCENSVRAGVEWKKLLGICRGAAVVGGFGSAAFPSFRVSK